MTYIHETYVVLERQYFETLDVLTQYLVTCTVYETMRVVLKENKNPWRELPFNRRAEQLELLKLWLREGRSEYDKEDHSLYRNVFASVVACLHAKDPNASPDLMPFISLFPLSP